MRQRLPLAVVLPAIAGVAFLVVPIVALVQRTPWSTLTDVLGTDAVADALRLSLIVSFSAAGLCLLIGTPIALVLGRARFPGRNLVRAIVLLPLVLPPVVGGTALLFGLGRRGLVGQWLDRWFGVTLPFTTAGAVVAATFVALPFFVLTVEAALRQADTRYEEVAMTLGGRPMHVLRRVTLPHIAPALVAGTVLSWARALGEFGATVTFAGNSPGRTRTLPLEIFIALETEPERALALSLVLVVISLAVLVGLRQRWWPA